MTYSSQLSLVAAYAAYSLFLILSKPLRWPYAWHPLGITAFIAFTTAGVATTQTLRGAVPGAKREATVSRHALLSWLAFFSLVAAQLAIYKSKESQAKPHLTSTHGQLGALTGVFFVQTLLAGAAMVAVPSLYAKFVKAREKALDCFSRRVFASTSLTFTPVCRFRSTARSATWCTSSLWCALVAVRGPMRARSCVVAGAEPLPLPPCQGNHAVAVSNGYVSAKSGEKGVLLLLLASQVGITLSAIQASKLPFGSSLAGSSKATL